VNEFKELVKQRTLPSEPQMMENFLHKTFVTDGG